jgi:hypothetical protein
MRHLKLIQGGKAVQESVNLKKALNRDLVLCFSELWPEGALLTQEAANRAKNVLSPEGAQFVFIDPAMASLLDYEDVIVEAEIGLMLRAYERLRT